MSELFSASELPAIRRTAAGRTDEEGAAAFLGVSRRTLRRYRRQGVGPAFCVVGRRNWYSLEDLESYLQTRTYNPQAI